MIWLTTIATVGIGASGCGIVLSSDSDFSTIVNDEPYEIETMLCTEQDCGTPGLPFFFQDRYNQRATLRAGEKDRYVNVPDDGAMQVYRVVRTSDHRELGCLPLVKPEPGPRLVARVSQRVPCTGDWDDDVRWPN